MLLAVKQKLWLVRMTLLLLKNTIVVNVVAAAVIRFIMRIDDDSDLTLTFLGLMILLRLRFVFLLTTVDDIIDGSINITTYLLTHSLVTYSLPWWQVISNIILLRLLDVTPRVYLSVCMCRNSCFCFIGSVFTSNHVRVCGVWDKCVVKLKRWAKLKK